MINAMSRMFETEEKQAKTLLFIVRKGENDDRPGKGGWSEPRVNAVVSDTALNAKGYGYDAFYSAEYMLRKERRRLEIKRLEQENWEKANKGKTRWL